MSWCSNSLATGYPDRFCGFRQSLQVNTGIVPYVRPWLLASTSFPDQCSCIILSFAVIQSELLRKLQINTFSLNAKRVSSFILCNKYIKRFLTPHIIIYVSKKQTHHINTTKLREAKNPLEQPFSIFLPRRSPSNNFRVSGNPCIKIIISTTHGILAWSVSCRHNNPIITVNALLNREWYFSVDLFYFGQEVKKRCLFFSIMISHGTPVEKPCPRITFGDSIP
jgi:hypothetical protein